jgi:protease I
VSVYGTKTACDKGLSGVNASEYDAVVFIGGPGAESLFNDPEAHKLARDTVSSGRILAAICIAPVILANAGVLKGRKATVFPGEEGFLVSGGALYTAKAVEKDGNIITADGPSSALEFARALAEALR